MNGVVMSVMFLILVLKEFQDREDQTHILKPGDILKTQDIERVNNILAQGLGKIHGVEPVNGGSAEPSDGVAVGDKVYEAGKVISALNEIGVKTAVNAGVAKLSEKVGMLDENQLAELVGKLSE